MIYSQNIETESLEGTKPEKQKGKPRIAPEDKPIARNLYLPKDIWDRLDEESKKLYMSRNAYILSLILKGLES